MDRGTRTAVAVALALGALAAAPAEAAGPRVVVRRPGGQFQPARAGRYLAWEQNTRARPGHFNVLARRGGRRPFKVNARGTQGANGGIDGPRLVYQQFAGGRSDLKLFDLSARKRRRLPGEVNTRHWEFWPSVSGRWLLFGRFARPAERRIVLYDLRAKRGRTLARTTSPGAFLAPGQVNGGWAVWAKCTPGTRCDVFRYNLRTHRRSKVPNVGAYQRAPSVSATGTVYFVRSKQRCGRKVKVMRYPRGGPTKLVQRVRGRRDVGDTYVQGGRRGARVLFDRRRCGRRAASNILAVREAAFWPLSARVEGASGGTVVSTPAGIDCGGDCSQGFRAGAAVTITARPESASNFTGWGGACSGSQATCSTTMTEARRVIAFFDPASAFALSVLRRGSGRGTVTSKPAGITCGADCWHSYRAGTAVTLSAAARPGSRFAGWSGACAGTGKCTVTMDKVRTATATFAPSAPAAADFRSYVGAPGASPPT